MTILADGAFGGIKPNERDAPPSDWQRTQLKPDIDWKFHHIIPWEMLRDTWQGLLMCQWWTEIALYVDAVGANESLVNRLKNKEMNHLDRDSLFARLSWPAWNIVEGPADRDDEGGTDLDLFQHGLMENELERMAAIHSLYLAMSAFLQYFDRKAMMQTRTTNQNATDSQYDPQTGSPQSIENCRLKVQQGLRGMTLYKTESYIAFHQEMWVLTLAPRVHRKYPVWLRKPRFQKSNGLPRTPAPHALQQSGLTQCNKCSKKFDALQAEAGSVTGLKLCPGCGANVYIRKNVFQDPAFTICRYCNTEYATPFGPAPCSSCYLPQ